MLDAPKVRILESRSWLSGVTAVAPDSDQCPRAHAKVLMLRQSRLGLER